MHKGRKGEKQTITIDEEFKSLIPPLSEDEYSQLEANCVMEGIRDPLVVWKKADGSLILLDGHNRMRISAEHGGIPFQIIEKEFESRDEAEIWIIQNQFGRRNLSAYDRSVLALKLKPLFAEQARKRQAQAGRREEVQKSAQAKTRDKLATIAGVSHDTIRKVEAIQNSGDDRLIQAVRENEMSINQAALIATGRTTKSPAQQKKEIVEQAKQTHEQVSSAQVVTIADARADRDAKETIASDLYRRCLKMGDAIVNIRFDAEDGDADLHLMATNVSDDEYQILLHTIASIESALTYIKKGLIR